MPSELLIDIGHSRIKWGWLSEPDLHLQQTGLADGKAAAALLLAELAVRDAQRVTVCAQSSPEQVSPLVEILEQHAAEVDIITTGDRPLPVAPAYAGLGCDRWLAMQWPWQQQHSALLVIDCGSAITADIVDNAGRHLGGWIMPGLTTARQGLFAHAPGLEQTLPQPGPIDVPARCTGEALARGSRMLALGGIEQIIAAANRVAGPNINLWLTGGDAAELAAGLSRPVRLEEHLVLLGLSLARR